MSAHRFGGSWTDEKLAHLRQYLVAYTTALKNQPFRKIYIDAFAGTGYRQPDADSSQTVLNLPGLNTLAKGSAATALEVEPSFDSFFFIEKHKERFEELKKLREKYPAKKAYMKFECADANEALARICSESNWHSSRAVLFLDPYGMQVDWKTLEKVAGTKAIDTWMLFPVGMGVDRLLPRDGDVPNEWQAALDRMLGSRSWREAFYAESNEQGDLLSERRPQRIKLAGPAAVEEYFLGRLKSVFAGVGRRGLPLKNSRGYLMYLLCFACGNPRATKVALGIANHLLKS